MKKLFENLGANTKETNTFLAMLRLGAQPASVIAKHFSVPRSSMYVILERLQKLQLVEAFNRGGITYFKCIPAGTIGDLLKARERNIKQTFNLLQESLPALRALENTLSITPKVRFLEGREGAAKLYEEVIKEKEFYAVFNPKSVKKSMPEYVYKVAEVLREYSGYAKELVMESSEADYYRKKYSSERHQIKILPKEVQFPSDTIICKNKIYMIAYDQRAISALEIDSDVLAQTQRALFEELWKRLQ